MNILKLHVCTVYFVASCSSCFSGATTSFTPMKLFPLMHTDSLSLFLDQGYMDTEKNRPHTNGLKATQKSATREESVNKMIAGLHCHREKRLYHPKETMGGIHVVMLHEKMTELDLFFSHS